MKIFLSVLILIFGLQSWVKADDIRDFEIEGMSVGDSLLDYYNLSEIKKQIKNDLYAGTNKKFSAVNIYGVKTDLFEGLQIHHKTNDKTFKIYGIDGIFAFSKDTNYCNKKRSIILDDISDMFSSLKKIEKENVKMSSGRGYMDRTQFFFKNEDFIEVVCYKYNVSGYSNHGRLGVVRKELSDWLVSIK